MAAVVKCPVCGESNAADQEFCQYCQSRLQPLTGPLKGADAPLHPGQIPTKKVTAELEPILPQWLRDARDKARHSVEEDISPAMRQPHQAAPSPASEPDLLAGLHSQSRGDDEEDTPDWLANITGVAPKSKKAGTESPGERRVELGAKDDFARDTAPLQESTPSWLASMQAQAASQDSEKDELKDWFRESSGLTAKQETAPPGDSAGRLNQEPAAPMADAPDWLGKLAEAGDSGSAPAWLDSDVRSDAQDAAPSPFAAADLNTADAGTASADEWLRGLPSDKPEPPLKKHTTPLWLKGTETPGAPAADVPDTPVWLDEAPSPAGTAPLESPPGFDDDATFGDIPSWLKAAAPQSSIFADSPDEETPAIPPEASGWLSTFKSEVAPPPAFSTDETAESAPPPAFTPEAFQDGSAAALFTEMPDWLSGAAEPPPAQSSPAPGSSDSIIPGELPSWVQAMRPVDTSSSRALPRSNDETLETRGALSGLQGVLPAVPGYAPSSKPKAFSIRMQATQEQQSHAALLEQILAAEAEPVPITSFSPLVTSRPLRWLLSIVVLVLLFGTLSLGTSIFTPAVSDREQKSFNGALSVANSVAMDAPVLVAVDYHAARAGEMEAAAAPMFDQMDILRHSRWVFISTNETGPVLAERFITGHTDNLGPLSKPDYQYGINYLNLGYLPGGVMGIRAFTQDPTHTMQFDTALTPAWSSGLLLGIESLSQFAALIVITDNAESARAWIEQTTALRAASPLPLVVITSAQAAPMLYPYFDSGQLSGIVNGLNGGAVFEQNNAGRPGTARRYWDAYSLGMLLAMSVILGGGLWSAAVSLRDRAAARGGR